MGHFPISKVNLIYSYDFSLCKENIPSYFLTPINFKIQIKLNIELKFINIQLKYMA